jgi:hypothetical protein
MDFLRLKSRRGKSVAGSTLSIASPSDGQEDKRQFSQEQRYQKYGRATSEGQEERCSATGNAAVTALVL